MSTPAGSHNSETGWGGESWFGSGSRRVLALAATALLIASYLRVLTYVTDIAGGTSRLILFVAGSFLAATLLARFLPAIGALVLAAVLFAVGLWSYVQAVPNGTFLLQSLGAVRTDILSLLTGLSILRIMEAGVWAIGFAPAPTFLAWYFALRRRYVAASVVGGAALGFFVLTGDATTPTVLAGVVGAVGVIGFGELERHGGSVRQAETLVLILVAIVVISPFVSVVPDGASQPLVPSGSAGGPTTVEGSLLASSNHVKIQGSITLSSEVRFTVESTHQDYWRVASYDRYTGQGWVRTGEANPYSGSLSGPPGNTTAIDQTYTVRSRMSIMPAAWKPTELSGGPQKNAEVTALGGVQPGGELANGTTYSVESQRPNATPAELRSAGTAYPDRITSRYTQLPRSVPNRVKRLTNQITAKATNPYDKARIIERWLKNTNNYSLNVSRPEGSIADSFLFDMQAGYCTYYATTMATMLRTQGIPTRFVTGYTDGQRVSRNKWVVRGLNSHAWVEVYFPDIGWVRFDPTPAGPRRSVEQSRLENARSDNESNVDINGSAAGEWTPTPTPTPIDTTPTSNGSGDGNATTDAAAGIEGQLRRAVNPGNGGAANVPTTTGTSGAADSGSGGGGSGGSGLPSLSPLQWVFALVLVVGLVAVARRRGVFERLYRELWVRFQPSGSPTEETERAFSRLEYLLAREHRPRRSGETPNQYLQVIDADDRATRVGEIFERAHYAGDVNRADADEANRLVDQLVAEHTPILGRIRRSWGKSGPDSI